VRYTAHRWRGASALVSVALGVGVGVCAAGIAFLNAVIGEYQIGDPTRVVHIWSVDPSTETRAIPTLAEFDVWAASLPIADVGAYKQGEVRIGYLGSTSIARALAMRGDVLGVIGARALIGRIDLKTSTDVVCGEAFWRAKLNSDPSAIGKILTIDGVAHTIVGVTSSGVRFPDNRTEVFVRLESADASTPVSVIARLSGSQTAAAFAEMLMAVRGGRSQGAPRIEATTFEQERRSRVLWGTIGLLGPPVLVLLVAWANCTGILFVTYERRRTEFAVRLALGADRAKLLMMCMRDFLPVSIATFFIASGVAGTILAALRRMAAAVDPDLSGRVVMSAHVMAVTAVVSFAVVVAVIIAPVWRATRIELASVLRGGAGTSLRAIGFRRTSLRDTAVALEIGVAVGLVVCTGLFGRYFWEIHHATVSLDAGRTIVVSLGLKDSSVPRQPDLRTIATEIEELGGVAAVGFSDSVPSPGLSGLRLVEFSVRGENHRAPVRLTSTAVSPGYFECVRQQTLRGRAFSWQDDAAGLPVAIVSRSLADRLWPAMNPVGEVLRIDPATPWNRVVGVVTDAVSIGGSARTPLVAFFPLGQTPRNKGYAFVRTHSSPGDTLPGLLRVVARATDGNAARVQSLTELIYGEFRGGELIVAVMGLFALTALLLCGAGTYALVSQLVSDNVPEIGLRMAVGASASAVMWLVVRRLSRTLVAGVVLGLIPTLIGVYSLWDDLLLSGGSAASAWLLIAAALLLTGTIAGLVPARSATRVDPMQTLRAL
jgi:putative ABC transport system permease protein